MAIIGRPNVGKSTLLNALVGEERAIVSPVAGTTRDAVDQSLVHAGVEYVFVDTAGIRRKGKTKLMAEKLSVVMARGHIRMANVVLLVLDATEKVQGLDATIAGYADEEGRAVILCVNKWDAAGDKGKRKFTEEIRDELKFLAYAPIAFVSAKTGAGVNRLFGMVSDAYRSASKRVSTGELNRFVEMLEFDRNMKIYYMTQGSVRTADVRGIHGQGEGSALLSERFLINQLRKRFGFEGTPMRSRPSGGKLECFGLWETAKNSVVIHGVGEVAEVHVGESTVSASMLCIPRQSRESCARIAPRG